MLVALPDYPRLNRASAEENGPLMANCKKHLLQVITMVKPREAVDLESAPEDILSVWGKEVTAKNIDKFFGSTGSHASEDFTLEGSCSKRVTGGKPGAGRAK